jgi:hypothetical protein
MGVRHYRGLTHTSSYSSWGDGVALYNLGGQYESVTFTIGHRDNKGDSKVSFKVYVDGVEIKCVPLTETMITKTYTINTSGAMQLKLELDLDSNNAAYAIFDVTGNAIDTDNSPKEHSYKKQIVTAAKFGVKGTMKYVCSVCGAYYTTEIPALTRKMTDSAVSVTLSNNVYTYDGKKKTPGVTVKYSGTELKEGQDYTVSYSNNINAGKATVTIKGKGFYKKSKKVKFSITPGKISLSSVKSTKSGEITVVFKKNAQASGYEIWCGRSYSFDNGKTLDVKSKTSATIKDLWKGEQYDVKVRAYKTVKGVKIYGGYSTVKEVVTKR